MPYRPPVSIDWSTYGDSLAHRLRVVRHHRGLTQDQLSERAGLHRNQVSNIERNASSGTRYADPHLSTIYRLAAALDVAPSVLLPDLEHLVKPRSPEQETKRDWSQVEQELARLLSSE